MRDVSISTRLNQYTADEAFDLVSKFRAYPDYSDAVISVDVEPLDDDTECEVDWRVRFRQGELCWSEKSRLDPVSRRIEFNRIKGDVATFYGEWTVAQEPDAACVSFKATFDLGIPILNDYLEPVAEKILVENIESILKGFFGEQIEFSRPH